MKNINDNQHTIVQSRRALTGIVCSILLSGCLSEHDYGKNDGPIKNPHKGWNSGWSKDYEESSVGFQYINWNKFEPTNDQFNFGYIEELLEKDGTRGRHFILRLHCDWDGEDDSQDGCPEWLFSEQGIERLRDNTGRYVTNYNNQKYITQAKQAIAQLDNFYDGDPRAYAFQIGMLGYWGEWHTSDFKEFEIDINAKNEILSAFQNRFTETKIMGRYPWREPLASAKGIGYHNDYFMPIGHGEIFGTTIFDRKDWPDGPVEPIGGEMPPENTFKKKGFDDLAGMYADKEWLDMIETGGYSTMKPTARPTGPGAAYNGYMEMHKKLGYNFQIEQARFADRTSSETLTSAVFLTVKNIGVAKLYYDWGIQFALLGANQTPLTTSDYSYDLSSLQPNDTFEIESVLNVENIEPGTYQLAVRVTQPGADKPKRDDWTPLPTASLVLSPADRWRKLDPTNTYIRFANDLEVIEGRWDESSGNGPILKGGWSLLGDVEFIDRSSP